MKTDPDGNESAAEFEKALAGADDGHYSMSLYVTGTTPRSVRAVETIKAICEQYLKGRYELEIIDLYQHPKLAKAARSSQRPRWSRRCPRPYGG